ncbi:MAG: 50S ribosomal protein L25 [Oscillochloridaceae bacterium]|nr:50S ribosomal protein L25 [Chloroflexaceae bacterium]MDW8392107.1 50S ribosomal protein L25 [Oscillochloridaceae bacterium]
MATQFTLDVQPREVLGKKVKHLRTQGLIPATVYGKGIEPASVQVNGRAFQTVYRKAGKTALIELHMGATTKAAFVQAVQRHPVTRDIIHIDFKVVDLHKAIHVEVPVVAIGTSPLVARGDALINHALHTVMIEALPANVPQHIDVDVSGLDALDKTIHVRDIPPSPAYKILTDGDEVLISLTPVRAAVAEGPVEEVPVEPELIRRERAKEEGEE